MPFGRTALRVAPATRLVAVWDSGSLAHVLGSESSLSIGRGEDCDLRIPDVAVSRCHARIHVGPVLEIEDLGSTNGTWVRGMRVPQGVREVISVATAVSLGGVMLFVTNAADPALDRARAQAPAWGEGMTRALAAADAVAPSDLGVLLVGDGRAGKELIAHRIHECSPRSGRPFVKVSCSALASTLDLDLFGYDHGVAGTRAGLLEGLGGGTLFLDEIGDLPIAAQAKLVRVLERGEVMRAGSLDGHPVDFRLIAGTTRDLRPLCARGLFREDLYYRIDGVSLLVSEPTPRRDDVDTEISTRKVVAPRAVDPARETNPAELAKLVEALTACAGNQTRAARLLGISRRTFVKRLDATGLPRPRKEVRRHHVGMP